MNTLLEAGDRSRHPVRAAVIAAALAVTACFGAAATFAADNAVASESLAPR